LRPITKRVIPIDLAIEARREEENFAMNCALILFAAIFLSFLAGCNNPTLLPNSDPNLRKTSTQFAADAARRHPYKYDAPSGGEALATARYNLTYNTIQILNYSDEDWTDVELWVNQCHVVYIPRLQKGEAGAKLIPFTMLFDDSGNSFSTDNGKNPIKSVTLYRKGKMYTVPFKIAD
jgi:hypothetical protein